jgi:YgiT-type zinc finger domain-containing protein
MTCPICRHGKPEPGHATVTVERGPTTVIIKDVPADVCDNCGEYWLSEQVTALVLALAEEAAQRGVEVEILRFAA